jgi:predicted acylesterase/phospholipase RssA
MDESIENEEKTIKHIVIAGGGITGLTYYGIIKETHNNGLWRYENLKSIYGTSVGALLAVILCLNYDWDTIDDYLIKRPWYNVYKFNMFSVLESYHKRGIFDIKVLEETFSPLFKGKDISLDITLKEFYELTNIEVHLFATEIVTNQLIDFSYKTHPDWKVIEVVYSSACLPIMFSPYIREDKCYCDGGIIENYPLESCIKNGANPNEILGLRKENIKINKISLVETSSLIDFISILFNNFISKLLVLNKTTNISNEYLIYSEPMSLYSMSNVMNNMEERIKLINLGVEMVTKRNGLTN